MTDSQRRLKDARPRAEGPESFWAALCRMMRALLAKVTRYYATQSG